MSDRKWIKLEEAIELAMKRTGKSRRQVKAMLAQHMRDGKLPARAYDLETGETIGPILPENIPPVH